MRERSPFLADFRQAAYNRQRLIGLGKAATGKQGGIGTDRLKGKQETMNWRQRIKGAGFWRSLVQWGFFFCVAVVGIRFGLFVRHFATGGAPYFERPPGVEGFLPIGALVSFKYWLLSGIIHPVHPAALVIFLTILALTLVVGKAFCGWLCPVGTLSEGLGKLGQRIFGGNFQIRGWFDVLLRGLKYAVLLFFIKLILLDMPAAALQRFLGSPYWAISDVRMLHFFTRISSLTLSVLAVLAGLSLLFRHFWCRYLCPYGALLGLIGLLSPLRIRRAPDRCTGCQSCSRACPAHLPVHRKTAIRSPECLACLSCVANCPETEALAMTPSFRQRPLPGWAFAALVTILFAAGIATGMATGHWHSTLTNADYRQLIPLADRFGH